MLALAVMRTSFIADGVHNKNEGKTKTKPELGTTKEHLSMTFIEIRYRCTRLSA